MKPKKILKIIMNAAIAVMGVFVVIGYCSTLILKKQENNNEIVI